MEHCQQKQDHNQWNFDIAKSPLFAMPTSLLLKTPSLKRTTTVECKSGYGLETETEVRSINIVLITIKI